MREAVQNALQCPTVMAVPAKPDRSRQRRTFCRSTGTSCARMGVGFEGEQPEQQLQASDRPARVERSSARPHPSAPAGTRSIRRLALVTSSFCGVCNAACTAGKAWVRFRSPSNTSTSSLLQHARFLTRARCALRPRLARIRGSRAARNCRRSASAGSSPASAASGARSPGTARPLRSAIRSTRSRSTGHAPTAARTSASTDCKQRHHGRPALLPRVAVELDVHHRFLDAGPGGPPRARPSNLDGRMDHGRTSRPIPAKALLTLATRQWHVVGDDLHDPVLRPTSRPHQAEHADHRRARRARSAPKRHKEDAAAASLAGSRDSTSAGGTLR